MSSVPTTAFWKVVRMRLPTNLYAGMPPRRASPWFMMREPNTALARPSTIGSIIDGSSSGAYWPSPWRSTTTSHPCSIAYW